MTDTTTDPDEPEDVETTAAIPITVVTGGSEGIGLALARRFSMGGHHVALVARDRDRLASAAAELRTGGATVIEVAADVTAPETPSLIVETLAARGYFVDVLINNAGIGLSGAFAEHAPEDVERALAVNVTALTRLTRHMLPGMVARRRGGILNVASMGGFMPGPYQALYYASKAYVLSLTEAIGWETRDTGVRVAVLAPGPVETRIHARMGADRALYRTLMPSISAARVAGFAYWGFRLRRRVIVPGIVWPLLALAARLTPHVMLNAIMGALLHTGPATASRQPLRK